MTRAVLEGAVFAVRDSVELARQAGSSPKRITVCGGGARSGVWLQMIANILDAELMLPKTEQGPGFGGAVLAAVADGSYDNVSTAIDAIVTLRPSVAPQEKSVEGYPRALFRMEVPVSRTEGSHAHHGGVGWRPIMCDLGRHSHASNVRVAPACPSRWICERKGIEALVLARAAKQVS